MFGNPKLVVLDEPNASLDDAGELALLQAMAYLKQLGSTVVVVTHKVSLLANVDKLLVMQDGALALFGPREAVLAHLIQRQQEAQQQGQGEAPPPPPSPEQVSPADPATTLDESVAATTVVEEAFHE